MSSVKSKIETPDNILHQYYEAVRLLHGEERAEKSDIYYSNGWYYINLASRFPDGSVGTINPPNAYRKSQVIEMTATLLAGLKRQ